MEFGQKPNQSRRLVGLAGVVIFHGLLIWALVSGLARKAIEVLPAPIETKIIEEIKPPDEPPPPPPPTLDVPPPPFVPPPEINIATPPPQHAITVQSTVPTPPPQPVPVVKAPPTVALKIDGKGCRPPDYPSVSLRLGESGVTSLQLLVGPDGRVKESKIAKSSGYPRLDEAARKALALCKFPPAMEDGQPVSAWGNLAYRWQIPD